MSARNEAAELYFAWRSRWLAQHRWAIYVLTEGETNE